MKKESIIYEERNGCEIYNAITEYIQKEGVWALFGVEHGSKEYQCLNVGKEKNVGSEIITDLGRLHYIPFRNNGDIQYTNQFNKKCNFKYKKGQAQEYLYPFLATKYCAFKFIYVHDKSDGDVEKRYAAEHDAKFWRNGSPYDVPKKPKSDREDIQLIGECFRNGGKTYTHQELLRKLKAELGYNESKAKRTITECELHGYITNVGNGVYTK